MAAKTEGQKLASTLRRYFSVGTRTRRYRKGSDLHEQMIEGIGLATQYPGYYAGETQRAFQSAWSVYCSYTKHVGGYRIDGTLRHHISNLTPYQFAALLGRMVDANVETTGDGERFFQSMAANLRTVRV